jgi:hypothetical protein
MKTIRFTERRTVDYLDGVGERVYEDGSTHTLRDDKAERWVKRQAAVYVADPEPVAPPAPPPPPAPAPEPAPAPAPEPAPSLAPVEPPAAPAAPAVKPASKKRK